MKWIHGKVRLPMTRLLCVNGGGGLFVGNQRVYFNCILLNTVFFYIYVFD